MATVIFSSAGEIWSVGAVDSLPEQRRYFGFDKQKMLEKLAGEIFQDRDRWEEVEAELGKLTWEPTQGHWARDSDLVRRKDDPPMFSNERTSSSETNLRRVGRRCVRSSDLAFAARVDTRWLLAKNG